MTARPDVRREIDRLTPATRSELRDLLAGRKPWPVYLWGPTGTGKTSAALCLLDHAGASRTDIDKEIARVRDWLAGYTDARNLTGLRMDCDQGRVRYSTGMTVTWDRLMDAAKRVPLFAVDEVGIATGDFRMDGLLELLELRVCNPVKPLVVTGNVQPSELASVYDDRIADRILSGTVVLMDGLSQRTQR